MIRSVLHPLALRQLPWRGFDFPDWQASAALLLANLLMGLASLTPEAGAGWPFAPAASPGILLTASGLAMLFYYAMTQTMRCWMQRGGRWDGRGNMFNLLATSTLVTQMLNGVLLALDAPDALIFALWLYGTWVLIKALSGAIAEASLACSAGGIIISYLIFGMCMAFSLFLLGIVIGMGWPHRI